MPFINGCFDLLLQMSQIIEDLRRIHAIRPGLLNRLDYLREFKQGIVMEDNDDSASQWEIISFILSINLIEFSSTARTFYTFWEIVLRL